MPIIIGIKKKDVAWAIRSVGDGGPVFGCGHDIKIHDKCNKKMDEKSNCFTANYAEQNSYNHPKVTICGGNTTDYHYPRKYLFQVIDYEVFQIV